MCVRPSRGLRPCPWGWPGSSAFSQPAWKLYCWTASSGPSPPPVLVGPGPQGLLDPRPCPSRSEANWHGPSPAPLSPDPHYLSPAWEGQYLICIALSPLAFYQYLMTGQGMLSEASPSVTPSNVTATEVSAGARAHRSSLQPRWPAPSLEPGAGSVVMSLN